MGAFSTPLSGLNAAQGQLQSVSNNLANIDTDGYKDQTLTFSDLFAQTGATNGAGDPIQTGSGVAVSATDSNFAEGTLNATGVSSNMAISGNGFFVVQSGSQVAYTRAGDFTTNTAGQITSPSGALVLGYPAVNGVVSSGAALQPLQVGSAPAASTTVDISGNLNTGTAAVVGPPAVPGVAGAGTSSIAVYDSLGNKYAGTVTFTETAPGSNSWTYSTAVNGATVAGGTGTLTFSATGVMTDTTAVPMTLTGLATGATSPQTVALSFGTVANPTITQTSAASAATATTDGSLTEQIASYAVGTDGTITGTFANGNTTVIGQVAVASFANVQGLVDIGGNNYQTTLSSGAPVTGVPGTNGAGTIIGGDVEGSNVDIASEFAKLIVAQQAYSASAKAITTFNSVSQATLAMIQ
jgi:flagellar hook protein FlgE